MSDPRIPSAEQEANVRKLADYPLPPSPPFDEESVEIFALIQKYLVAAIAWADAERDRADMAERERDRVRKLLDEWISAATSNDEFGRVTREVVPFRLREDIAKAVDYMHRVLAAETREREAVARAEMACRCTTCGGVGRATLDFPCICGGTGRAQDALNNMRVELTEKRERAHSARANAFAEVVVWLQGGNERTWNRAYLESGARADMFIAWLRDRIEELGKKGAG